MPSVLIVDDELSMREFLSIFLEKEGYTTTSVKDGSGAIDVLQNENIDLVISDIRMPGMSGLKLLERIKAINSAIPVIMVTAYASPDDAVLAMKEGAYDYLTKPFKVEEVKSVISKAFASISLPRHQGRGDNGHFRDIIAACPEMLKIFDLIRRIAPTQANVLIYGESGTGKELVARAIHNESGESGKPFVPITCSAIPEGLFESELFGHVKGAFTGAVSSKEGLLESADNGTVFLDEVGELTPLIQTKLLRVLQEREFKRVGGTETVKVNVRIISATNRDLEEEIMAGRFREDLFYRLAVVPVRVPPLRERKEDVPLLIEHFLNEYSRKFGKDVRSVSSYALKVLMEYDYPGNVRELENIIERGVALEGSSIILPESLTLSAHRKGKNRGPASLPPAAGFNEEEVLELGLEEVMHRMEKRLLAYALDKAGNSKMRAAELLKISFRSLRYKVQKYNLNP